LSVEYSELYRIDNRALVATRVNTISGLAEFERSARSDLLTMGGLELTTYSGHALALGVRQWIDWRVQPNIRTMPDIAAEVAMVGGLFVIAHPMSVGDPICTGCDWHYSDIMPGPARCIEVWNGHRWTSESNNEDALALWYVWLNRGYRMVGTAGTDIHGPLPDGAQPAFNVVYAASLAEQAILEAIGQGHLYLSNGPHLEFTARNDRGDVAMMGDCLMIGNGTITASSHGHLADDQIRLIADGKVLFHQQAGASSDFEWKLSSGAARWYVVELRDQVGSLRAVTNPIFIGQPE
jgi:hypothetical protein